MLSYRAIQIYLGNVIFTQHIYVYALSVIVDVHSSLPDNCNQELRKGTVEVRRIHTLNVVEEIENAYTFCNIHCSHMMKVFDCLQQSKLVRQSDTTHSRCKLENIALYRIDFSHLKSLFILM